MDVFSVHSVPRSDPAAHRPDGDPVVPSRCVLVADDERFIVDLISTLLEEEGFQVLKAYDGEEAWELARRNRPALVISDVSMPRLDGLGLLDRLRGTRGLSQTPVILMISARRPLDVDRAASGPTPFDIDAMLSLIETELAAN